MGIRYELPNGKFVYLTLEQALDMDNLETFQDLLADDPGYESDNPFDDGFDERPDPVIWSLPEPEPEKLPEEIKSSLKEDWDLG